MNRKAKGSRAERKSKLLLEQQGMSVTKAGGSLGIWDLVAIGSASIRLIQVKAGTARPTREEKEAMAAFVCPSLCSKELWSWKDYAREPAVTVLSGSLA